MEISLPAISDHAAGRDSPILIRARELVLAYGWNSTSFQIVNPGIRRWFSAENDAVAGYMSAGGFRVVAGAPACTVERLLTVVSEFEADAAASGERVCYFAAESRLEDLVSASKRHSKFLLGAQPSWRPADWPQIVASQKSLRAQINRAKNKGVTVEEWPAEKAHDNSRLRRCLKQWLNSKGLPPLHFMVEPDTLCRLENRRIFVATRGEDVVGFVMLSPVAQRNGWLFEQFPHIPGAPNGTVELMVDTAMRAVAADGAEYATLGLSPLSTRASVPPFDNPLWLKFVLSWLHKHGKRFYNFDGLDAFKAKLRPQTWEPVFAVSNEPRVSVRAVYAITSAFSGHAPAKMVLGGLGRAIAVELERAAAKLKSLFS
ncbi:MAG: DUF2156 domain-containing protein [Acidobacteriota bacterium]